MEPDLSKMMQQLAGVKEQLARVQEELENMSVSGESGGGMVKATMNGKHQLVSIALENEVIDPNEKEMLEDLIVAAVNHALEKSNQLSETRMAEAARTMLPGFPPL